MLRDDQIGRYARHLLLPEVGRAGQERLLAGAVSVAVTAGDGAAVAAIAYLAAAGVGRIELAGDLRGPVTGADLAAGLLYRRADLGRPRGEVLRARVADLNPDVQVGEGSTGHPVPLSAPLSPSPLPDALIAGSAAAAATLAALLRP